MLWFEPIETALHLHWIVSAFATQLRNSEFTVVDCGRGEFFDVFCGAHSTLVNISAGL
jgi:hypothetical protein